MKYIPPRRRQRGAALWLLLVLVLLTGSYAYYRSSNLQPSRYSRDGELNLTLAKAKEALIAYAVIDANRPGRLPCPDLIGDGVSPLLTRDDCDSYSGNLPWRTLDLQESGDGQSGSFRYVLSPLFGGDRSTPPLNSDTATSLRLDVAAGQPSNEIVALIIAPRGPVDTRNADGDDYFYRGSGDSPEDNDIILPITRRELMAAVERRIAREVNNCLEQHATSAQNPSQTYPWPAPLGGFENNGKQGSLFGFVPSTQPGNPKQALQAALDKITEASNRLSSDPTVGAQLEALYELQSQTAYARAFFDNLYLSALDLNTKALGALELFGLLNVDMRTATASAGSFATQFPSVRERIVPALDEKLLPFLESLNRLRLKLFVLEGLEEASALATDIISAETSPSKGKFTALKNQVTPLKKKYLDFSQTPNTQFSTDLMFVKATAETAASNAKAAEESPNDQALAAQATSSARVLLGLLSDLTSKSDASLTSDAGSLKLLGLRIWITSTQTLSLPVDDAKTINQAILEPAKNDVLYANTRRTDLSATAVTSARNSTIDAINTASAGVNNATSSNSVAGFSKSAASSITGFGDLLTGNGEVIEQLSLLHFARVLQEIVDIPPANSTQAKNKLFPSGSGAATEALVFWITSALNQSAIVARKARRGVSSSYDSESSAYVAANRLLAKLDGETGAINALKRYQTTPSAGNQIDATLKLSEVANLIAPLLESADSLKPFMNNEEQEGLLPTLWFSDACNRLKPNTGSGSPQSWLEQRDWHKLIFYQISSQLRPVTGSLTVNGQGTYRTVTLSAGTAINPGSGLQNRSLRETRSYLEGRNTHVSRDGSAKTPVTDFENTPPSATFNDRLAY